MMTKHIIDNFYLQKHKYILFSGLACNRGQYYELHMYLCIVYTLYVCNKYNVGPYYVHWIRDLLQPFFLFGYFWSNSFSTGHYENSGG